MLSKEEILDKHEGKGYMSLRTRALEAMDEYAKQIAIEFSLWLIEQEYYRNGPDEWIGYFNDELKTTDQLYQQYLNSKANAK